jgi:16S rRNA (guanine527-N7)-methyltransferase
MNSLHPIRAWFPELDDSRWLLLERFHELFRDWNSRINLVSRQDMDQFAVHHVAHALALLKVARFGPRTRVLDVGTGGGLPGLPLAIACPQAQFHLCDSVGKKIRAVGEMARELGLENVQAVHKRAEELESKWDYVLGRAVTAMPRFLEWIEGNVRPGAAAGVANGVFYWKGSLYADELASIGRQPDAVHPVDQWLPDPYFAGKFIVYLRRRGG